MNKNLTAILLGCCIACSLIVLSSCPFPQEPQMYAITFDSNGGSAVLLQRVQENVQATRPADPTKIGFTFDTWYAEDTFATEWDFTTPISTDMTLYANWIADTYVVTYNANNATSGEVPPDQSKTYGVSLTITTNSGNLERIGYIFDGWNTQANGLGTTYATGSSYTANEEVTLYAKWIAITKRITFIAENATLPNPASKEVTYDQPYGVLATTARTGHTFGGWWTGVDRTGENVTESKVFTEVTDQILYAGWIADTYAVLYDANNATSGVIPAAQTKTYNIDLPVATNSGNLERENHIFVGWSTHAEGIWGNYAVGSYYTYNSGITLYANWVFSVQPGPAGGFVFYENPTYASDGWRYLEVAPYGWYEGATDSEGGYTGDEDPYFQWGEVESSISRTATDTAIGTGKTNTAAIIDHHNSLGTYYTNPTGFNGASDGTVAAKVCAEYSVEKDGTTYEDWFLPSQVELYQLYRTVKNQEYGGFSTYRYWSSSQQSKNHAYLQVFDTGAQMSTVKHRIFHVRPIRAF